MQLYAPRQLTIATVIKVLRQHGITLKRDVRLDEYQVTQYGLGPNTTYYTNDLADAVGTGLAMAQEAQS